MKNQNSVVPINQQFQSDGSKDPLKIMLEIAESKDLSPEDKTALIHYAQRKFVNRRRMAYMALTSIIVSLVLLFAGAFIQAFKPHVNVLQIISDNGSLIIWIEGFLTAIVSAYFGISAWRPSS